MKTLIFILIILSFMTITASLSIGDREFCITEKAANCISKLCGLAAAVLYAIFIL